MRELFSKYQFLSIALLVISPVFLFGQYLINPSFEGVPLMIGPPPEWDICIEGSTPNVQPGKYSVYVPPSDGNTYIGMFTRLDGTWEDTQATLNTPLSQDSCYIFKIDLAYQQHLTYNDVDPITLKIYGDENFCQKENLLWQSPIISNEDWMEFEFLVHNEEFNINDLVLEAGFNNPDYPSWGYVLIDNIRITPTPSIDLGPDTTIIVCDGGVGFDLDAGEGYSEYLWQDGSIEQTQYVDTTGIYWVQITTSEGCTATDSIYVTIEEYLEMEIETSGDIGICQGQETWIGVSISNGLPPYNFEWEDLTDVADTIYVSPDTTTTYYITVTDTCGGLITDSITVIVFPAPEINLGNDTILCGSDTLLLEPGYGYYLYLWQDESSNSSYLVTEAGEYWVQVTSQNGCASFDQITVAHFPDVEVDIGNDTIICENDSLLLDPGDAYIDFQWQDGSTGQTFVVFESGVYSVLVTDISGCQGIDSINVLINDTATVVDLGNDTILCDGEIYEIIPGDYLSYLWQNGSTSPTFSVSEAGIYSVSVFGGCNYDTDSISISYFPPTSVNLGPDTNLCYGQSIELDAGFGFISIEWQDGSSSQIYDVTESGLYYVSVEDINTCVGGDTIMIGVGNEVDLDSDTSFCEGEVLMLDAGFGYDNYSWSSGSVERYEEINQDGLYWVTVSYNFGCPSSDSIYIEMMNLPVCDLGNDGILCQGETIVLTAPEGNYNYFWNGIEGDSSYIVTSGGIYELRLINGCGEDTDEISINEYPLPNVNLGNDILLFPGDEVQVDAGEFVSYQWQDGSNGQYYLVSFTDYPDSLHVEVFDGYCYNTDAIDIEVYNVTVPLVITPNGDGQNDIFMPKGDWSGINENKILVYNRWGKKVWESSDFLSGWDGKNNGRYVAEGTYFWVLEVNYGIENLSKTYRGSLTVLGTN